MVLNELLGRFPHAQVRYWRTKQKHEIDFIFLQKRNSAPVTIECKWSANNFNAKNLSRFREKYPEGDNFVVASDVERLHERMSGGNKVKFVNLEQLVELLS